MPRTRSQPTPEQQPPPDAADSTAQNRIRSSSVHIPAALLDHVIAERARSNRSNGEIIIAAIEQTHAALPTLIGQRAPTGGGLFAGAEPLGISPDVVAHLAAAGRG